MQIYLTSSPLPQLSPPFPCLILSFSLCLSFSDVPMMKALNTMRCVVCSVSSSRFEWLWSALLHVRSIMSLKGVDCGGLTRRPLALQWVKCGEVSVSVSNSDLRLLFPLPSVSGCAKSGGVRFSEVAPPAAGAPSHVHFDEKLHDSVVMVTPEDDGNFMVKVGLTLQQPRTWKPVNETCFLAFPFKKLSG